MELRLPRDAKVEPGKLFTFLESVLKINLDDDLYCVQPEYKRKVVTLCFKSKDRCQEVADLDTGSLTIDNNKVSLSFTGSCVPVRVLDLPWRMPHSAVMKALSPYGTFVGDMEYEFWRRNNKRLNVSNGTRVVKMTVTKNIPSFLNIEGCAAVVTYPSQQRTCAWCNGPHLVKDCQKKKEKREKTWASIARGPQSPPPTPLITPSVADLLSTNINSGVGSSRPPSPSPSLGSGSGDGSKADGGRQNPFPLLSPGVNSGGRESGSTQSAPLPPPPNSGGVAECSSSSGQQPPPSSPRASGGGGDEKQHSSDSAPPPSSLTSSGEVGQGEGKSSPRASVSNTPSGDTPADRDSSEAARGEQQVSDMLRLFLRRDKESCSIPGTEESEKSSGAGCDTGDTNSSRFDWAEESLQSHFLTLRGDTPCTQEPQGAGKKPGKFFVNASPVLDEEFVFPNSTPSAGVLQDQQGQSQDNEEEESQPNSDEESESEQGVGAGGEGRGDGWEPVQPRQPRQPRSRGRASRGIPGLTGGGRQRLTSQQRLQKALGATNPAGFSAHLARMKRSGSDLTRESSSKRSKERSPNRK